MEMPEVIEEKKEELPEVYIAVDQEDPIDVLVAAQLTSKFSGVSISRQTPGLYLIENKSVTLKLEGENQDQLKARVGSSFINFTDYMTQVKSRVAQEEDDSADVVQAALEDPSDDVSAAQAQSAAAPGKAKKKKKKKAKKAKVSDLDLDMDNDDASQQTRFANIVPSSPANEESKDSTSAGSNPQPSPKARKTKRKSKIPVAGGLHALEEVDEDEDSESDE